MSYFIIAFERVDHGILFDKLKNAGVPVYILNILQQIFYNSFISVCYENFNSFSWKTKCSLRQGDVLSALLFSFYIDSVLRQISRTPVGCMLGLNKINILAYADDIVLVSPTSGGLQVLLDKITLLLDKLKLRINVAKTVTTIFNDKKYVSANLSFYMHGSVLSKVFQYKYLGCILTPDLCDELDIGKNVKSYTKSFGVSFRKFYSVDSDILYSLFNSFCASFYGSELWANFPIHRNFRQISFSYHNALKKILGLHRIL